MEDLGSRANFDRMGTLGVEEEFYVVDDRGLPVSGTEELVYGDDEPPAPLAERLDHELFQFTIETQTPLIEAVADVEENLLAVREALVDYAEGHGYRIAAAGLHPEARWRELDHAEKPRYRSQLERIQYPQHRNTTAGLHVHVGVDDPDKAVWIANELRWELPPMLALSANSPFWNGFDTGLASARSKVFENLPNTGMPTRFADYEAYERFERRMVERGAIEDRGELWYDVRPHTGHGTVEVRTPDAQADPEVVRAFVEGAHALVTDLAERYEDGERGPLGTGIRRELLDENKWRAMRHGHDATFLDRDGESTIGLAEAVERTCDRIGDDALAALLDRESGSRRQRRIHENSGSEALRESLVL
ncbi:MULTISPECIES: glutamate--cysteine ligase [Halolamina]|uniref:Glutamate--cysteine ligase n=1 Tax=Halolamina pelagica TaxID=699431 RepID=A0A1I5M4Y5_9EURY|nr:MULTISPECIES: glutamate--cysteine ligase [Halolamina]NHX35847.1 glutamate--cysteine ligase [Halolamina sp. R1-12]SFP04081.1 carboxylate-amine ligase [Halolamina pelagica]